MEFLPKDVDNQVLALPPENQLLPVQRAGPSEHELRIRRSLQKLDLPNWFRNSALGQGGGTAAASSLLRRSEQHAGRWADMRSRSTSSASLSKPPGTTSRESLLSPAFSDRPSSSYFQYGMSRWSSSRLSSASSRSTSPTASTTRSVGSVNSRRKPYLGWRSSEKLGVVGPVFYRSAAERLSQGPGYYALRFGCYGGAAQVVESSSPVAGSGPEIRVSVFDGNTTASEHVPHAAAELKRAIDKMIGANGSEADRKCVWMESSFVGARPEEARSEDAEHRLSLTTTTLEEVLDSLLALPSSSQSPSPSGYRNTRWDDEDAQMRTGQEHEQKTKGEEDSVATHLQESDSEQQPATASNYSSSSSSSKCSATTSSVCHSTKSTSGSSELTSSTSGQSCWSGTSSGSSGKDGLVLLPPPEFEDSFLPLTHSLVNDFRHSISPVHETEDEDASLCGTYPLPESKEPVQAGMPEELPCIAVVEEQHVPSADMDNDDDDIPAVADQRVESVAEQQQPQLLDDAVVVRCSHHLCNRMAELSDARKSFKTCHNCYTYYCSRECRKAHWEKHRHVCMFGRIRTMCKQAIQHARDNGNIILHLSRIARTGYLTQGRGFVKILFRNTDLATRFLRQGWSNMEDGPVYLAWKDLLPEEMGSEVYRAVVEMCKRYDPDNKFVLLTAIYISREVPVQAVPHWEREIIAKCARLSLACRDDGLNHDPNAASTLILTAPSDQGIDGDVESQRKAREVCLANIEEQLKGRGVSLHHQFPDVYQRLCSFVDNDDPFPPMTIYPRDGLTGQTFMCIIMPNSTGSEIHDWWKIIAKK